MIAMTRFFFWGLRFLVLHPLTLPLLAHNVPRRLVAVADALLRIVDIGKLLLLRRLVVSTYESQSTGYDLCVLSDQSIEPHYTL
jgi:predicted Na+-dependent transporter